MNSSSFLPFIVQPYGAKKYPIFALRGKSTKLGSVIALGLLVILSYGPHRNTQGGRHNVPLGGRVVTVCLGQKIS